MDGGLLAAPLNGRISRPAFKLHVKIGARRERGAASTVRRERVAASTVGGASLHSSDRLDTSMLGYRARESQRGWRVLSWAPSVAGVWQAALPNSFLSIRVSFAGLTVDSASHGIRRRGVGHAGDGDQRGVVILASMLVRRCSPFAHARARVTPAVQAGPARRGAVAVMRSCGQSRSH